MPKIYGNDQREAIREGLMETGLALLQQGGLRDMRIQTLSRKVGIAPGTFYHFFPSKEILVYQLIERYREKLNRRFAKLVEDKGYVDREDLKAIYMDMMLRDNDNVLRLLTGDELRILLARLPQEYQSTADIRETIIRNRQFIRSERQNINYAACMNWIQIMNLTAENLDLLDPEAYAHNMEEIIICFLNELY